VDESNPYSLIPDGRSAQRDYYKLENRERQLKAVSTLTPEEKRYILGGVGDERVSSARAASTGFGDDTDAATVADKLNRIHEKDLIELRAMVYLQSLPDTSPELNQLRIMTNLHTREQIAEFIAEKQIKKLMMEQINLITGGDSLTKVYKETIKKGPDAFKKLFD
jgi:hypothetical protein